MGAAIGMLIAIGFLCIAGALSYGGLYVIRKLRRR